MQIHHWLPLSLWGIDSGANKIAVTVGLHGIIHKTMNYPYRQYTRAWRRYRQKWNSAIFVSEEMCVDRLQMQMAYLDKWHKLPEIAQQMHFQKMNELCFYYDETHRWDSNWRFLKKKYEICYTNHHAIV